ncbi:hypothetical protein GJ744_008774 [Endocarpon pusillum]|uniref:Large ribosomal subunit protein uL5m n=1 Tax=Endocarpon pusillum TaxID=364733 RepID=A0A8H7AQ97_9EURO|nr:hypothetical protein GJ744_008774 [Endocarpon pusillum]
MVSTDKSCQLTRALRRISRPAICTRCLKARRSVTVDVRSDSIQDPTDELEQSSGLGSSGPLGALSDSFDPLRASRSRKKQLPPSRYQFRPPKYDRGPLHPHQPPPASDPSSRIFVPGPFSSSRVEQTYHNMIAPDILTLCYQHNPPGYRPPPKAPRLRSWDDSSPYHANRQLRGPRGGDVLRLLRKPITFRNIPMIERITVHTFVKQVIKEGSAPLHVAGMVLQAITNVRVQTHKSRTGEAGWNLVPGKSMAATATLKGEDMYHFLGKLVNVVLPRIKDWRGVRATTGDGSGNLTFGLDPEVVGGFPEIEINYDSYPQKMIPGCNITIHTTANTDKDARLLLQTVGIPFCGKVVN